MKNITPPKKGLVTIIVILLVLLSVGLLAARSGALKLNFTVSKNTPAKNVPAKDLKIPSSALTPPPGWEKSTADANKGQLAHFESTEIDTETDSKDGTITTNAVIDVKVAGNYQDLDDFVSQYKASGSKLVGYQIISSPTLESGGQKLELKYQAKVGDGSVVIHELSYLFFKDGVSFLIKGYSADSAWGKHEREITTSLDTFRFK